MLASHLLLPSVNSTLGDIAKTKEVVPIPTIRTLRTLPRQRELAVRKLMREKHRRVMRASMNRSSSASNAAPRTASNHSLDPVLTEVISLTAIVEASAVLVDMLPGEVTVADLLEVFHPLLGFGCRSRRVCGSGGNSRLEDNVSSQGNCRCGERWIVH